MDFLVSFIEETTNKQHETTKKEWKPSLLVMNTCWEFADYLYRSLLSGSHHIDVNTCDFVVVRKEYNRTTKLKNTKSYRKQYQVRINDAVICSIGNERGFTEFLLSSIKVLAFFGAKK